MCTEFFLALIYFSTILTINFFLIQFLISNFQILFSLLKLKNIFHYFPKNEKNVCLFLYEISRKKLKNRSLLPELKNLTKTEDVLIIGNTYKWISNSFKNSKSNVVYYFQLLAVQYLSE